MKRQFFSFLFLFFCFSLMAQSLENSPWHIVAQKIDPNHYYGVTCANGMVGLISSPGPMRVKDVVLNGVYDNYQRGRVSNILKTSNHVNLDLDIRDKKVSDDFIRVGRHMISNYEQVLDMKQAILITTFDVEDKVAVSHRMMSLRHLPFSAMVIVRITAKKDLEISPISVLKGVGKDEKEFMVK